MQDNNEVDRVADWLLHEAASWEARGRESASRHYSQTAAECRGTARGLLMARDRLLHIDTALTASHRIGEYRTLLHKTIYLRGGISGLARQVVFMSELDAMWQTLTEDEQRELRAASQTPTDVRNMPGRSLHEKR